MESLRYDSSYSDRSFHLESPELGYERFNRDVVMGS